MLVDVASLLFIRVKGGTLHRRRLERRLALKAERAAQLSRARLKGCSKGCARVVARGARGVARGALLHYSSAM